MAEDPRSGFTEVQGIRLHYREWGDPGAPDLLLVHGWTNYSLGWAGVAEHFAGRYHVVAPDLRGHGESDKPQTGYRLRDFAEDVHQFIANLGLERPAYAGHSWGGNIGTILASDHPEDISRAFLEDPVYWRMQHAFVTALPGGLARLSRPEAEIRAEARERGLSPEQEDWEVYRNRHFSAHALTRLLTDNRDWALASEERLRRIQVPTLILVGDATVSPQPGAILAQELGHLRTIASPQVAFEFWEGVGHMMRGTRPDAYNERLDRWLSGS